MAAVGDSKKTGLMVVMLQQRLASRNVGREVKFLPTLLSIRSQGHGWGLHQTHRGKDKLVPHQPVAWLKSGASGPPRTPCCVCGLPFVEKDTNCG